MTTMKGLERTCLVNDRDTKRYSLALGSIGLSQHNSNPENHHEESTDSGPSPSHHCHDQASKAYEDRQREQHRAKNQLYVASVICLVFMVAEIVGGRIAGSLAVIMDAAHVSVDLMSFLISIVSLWLSSKSPSKRLTYGWHRAEILGAFLSVIVIWVVTGVLTYLAVLRLLHPYYEIEATVMLITSACAVIANVILSLTLHQAAHGNSHNAQQKCGHTSDLEHKLASANASVRAAFVHVIGDLFQSISVLISALIIFFQLQRMKLGDYLWVICVVELQGNLVSSPEYKIADPICTFVFSAFVLATTSTILRDILLILMEGTPKGFSYDTVKGTILALEKVDSVHNLHLWTLTMNQAVLSAHIVTEDTVDKHQILKELTDILFDTYNFHTITLQIEPKADQKLECIFCQDPRD